MEAELKQFVDVAVALPVRGTFTYSIPEHFRGIDLVGQPVLVPFGRRRVSGIVLRMLDMPGEELHDIKPLEDLLPFVPALTPEMLELMLFTAEYYFYPPGEVFKGFLPPGVLSFSRMSIVITPEGLKHIKDESNTEEVKKILELARAGRDLKFISKDRMIRRSTIMNLVKSGWIEIKEMVKKGGQKPKEETFYVFKQYPDQTISLDEKERDLLQVIRQEGGVSSKELKKRFKNVSKILNRLVDAGYIKVEKRVVNRIPELELDGETEAVEELNESQKSAINKIQTAVINREHRVFLLYGVTGSGKTEVYLRAIETCLSRGMGAIYLVPEISLTPQQVLRLRKRFGETVAVLHSAMSRGERFDEWRMLREGKKRVVIGARSAIFAPVLNPGLIIVDEEHDPSYKQEEKLRYNARDLAIVRGRINNAPVILGSATPSIESFYLARKGDYVLLTLPERAVNRELPEVEIVDMRKEKNGIFSEKLKEAIKKTIGQNEQAILFLNRRGFAPFVLCVDCGYQFRCPNCSVSMVFHSYTGYLQCHYCNYRIILPEVCPSCRGVKLRQFGYGTERIEKELKDIVPEERILRLDRDTTGGKASFSRMFMQMRKGEKNILIGTQMVSKGLHFPNVTLVGVILAEQGLQFPDFRASERTFQLLMQVAGRAGRGTKGGRVIIQTYDPEQPSIQSASRLDYELFYNNEIHYRQELLYPPFSSLVAIRINGKDRNGVESRAKFLAEALRQIINQEFVSDRVQLLGPAPAALYKLKNVYRWLILLKSPQPESLRRVILKLQEIRDVKKLPGMIIDVDPQSMI